MSHMHQAIDRHIAAVKSKLVARLFLQAAGWTLVGLGSATVCGVLAHRFFNVLNLSLRNFELGLAGALAAGTAACALFAFARRPSDMETAIHIDHALGTHERLSTAIELRKLSKADKEFASPFAAAALADAEQKAGEVTTKARFKIGWNNQLSTGLGIAVAAALLWTFVPQMDLLGRHEKQVALATKQKKQEAVKKEVQQALATITKQAPIVKDDASVAAAKKELEALLSKPIEDLGAAQRSTLNAAQELAKAVQAKVETSQAFAQAEQDRKAFSQMKTDPNDDSNLGQAQKAISNGKFEDAQKEIEKAVNDFDKLSADKQAEQAEKMARMAQQLQQLSQAPANQEKTQQAMQQAMEKQGMKSSEAQQLAQQMQKQMQAAAAGDQQAQQQMKQMADQAMQKMNSGQGPTPQQQQDLQKAMQQMQSQAQSQMQSQQMAQAAQKMANAMKQGAQQSQQAQQKQQGAGQKQGQGQKQDQAQGQKGGSQGQKPGQSAPAGQQGMQQAMQDMKDQLSAMQSMQNDADQLSEANSAAQQAQSDQASNCNGNGKKPGDFKEGEISPGESHGDSKGGGGPKRGSGDRTFKQEAPYSVKKEHAPTQNIASGKLLASSLVKIGNDRGKAEEAVKEVARQTEQEEAEDVEIDRVSKSSQKAVHDYFAALQQLPGTSGATTRP